VKGAAVGNPVACILFGSYLALWDAGAPGFVKGAVVGNPVVCILFSSYLALWGAGACTGELFRRCRLPGLDAGGGAHFGRCMERPYSGGLW